MLHIVADPHRLSRACAPRPRHNARSAYRKVEGAVATELRVAVRAMRAPGRGPAGVAFARQTAMYLAHTGLGLSLSAVAGAARRDRTTVAHACRLVEGRRDEPVVEAMLLRLERMVTEGAR